MWLKITTITCTPFKPYLKIIYLRSDVQVVEKILICDHAEF